MHRLRMKRQLNIIPETEMAMVPMPLVVMMTWLGTLA